MIRSGQWRLVSVVLEDFFSKSRFYIFLSVTSSALCRGSAAVQQFFLRYSTQPVENSALLVGGRQQKDSGLAASTMFGAIYKFTRSIFLQYII